MKSRRLLFVFVILMVPGSPGQIVCGQEEPPEEPPAVGQPENFSQLMGQFKIATTATPDAVYLEEPILFKVRITGNGPNKNYLPQRKNLKVLLKELEASFYIGDVPEQDKFVPGPRESTWEFTYKLIPRNDSVTAIPLLTLVFFNPKLPAEFAYQPSYAPAIPIKVKLRPHVIVAPERMYALATGAGVFRTEEQMVTWWLLPLGLVLPPALSLFAFYLWRYFHPGQTTLARRLQSRAAREALQALQRLPADPAGVQGSALFTRYLQARLNLGSVEPTPYEAILTSGGAGLSLELTERVANYYRGVHEARFSPSANKALMDLRKQAMDLIQAVEEEAR